MTIALLTALLLAVAAFLVLLDRAGKRAERERAAEREERQVLLQRIQAPSEAVFEHSIKAADSPATAPTAPAPAMDDDDAYWKQRGDISREQLAEALMAHELEGRL